MGRFQTGNTEYTKARKSRWAKAEIDELRRLGPTATAKKLSEHFGRSVGSIKSACFRYGVNYLDQEDQWFGPINIPQRVIRYWYRHYERDEIAAIRRRWLETFNRMDWN